MRSKKLSEVIENKANAWNESYARLENHVFAPADEVVRFVARYLRRRKGLHEVVDVYPGAAGSRVLDAGCGIGRNLVFGAEMGLNMYGCDLSAGAIDTARAWLAETVGELEDEQVVACDIREQPWADNSFDHAMSDSALDSMPFEIAQDGIREIARCVRPGGYFYCNLISGDETGRDPEFCGEELVETQHEANTIQSYFNRTKIRRLLEPQFEIISCQLHQIRDPLHERHSGRWHVVTRRR